MPISPSFFPTANIFWRTAFSKNSRRFLIALAVFAGCGEAEKPEKRFEKMASGLCDCLTPMVAANAEAEKVMADPAAADTAAVAQVFEKMAAADARARACAQVLKDRFQPLKKADWAAAKPIFEAKCPLAASKTPLVWQFLGDEND